MKLINVSNKYDTYEYLSCLNHGRHFFRIYSIVLMTVFLQWKKTSDISKHTFGLCREHVWTVHTKLQCKHLALVVL